MCPPSFGISTEVTDTYFFHNRFKNGGVLSRLKFLFTMQACHTYCSLYGILVFSVHCSEYRKTQFRYGLLVTAILSKVCAVIAGLGKLQPKRLHKAITSIGAVYITKGSYNPLRYQTGQQVNVGENCLCWSAKQNPQHCSIPVHK